MPAQIGLGLLGLPSAFPERALADDLVRLPGSVDDQHPGLRIVTPTGVKASIGRPMTLVMAMSGSGHVLMVRQVGAHVFRVRYGSPVSRMPTLTSPGSRVR